MIIILFLIGTALVAQTKLSTPAIILPPANQATGSILEMQDSTSQFFLGLQTPTTLPITVISSATAANPMVLTTATAMTIKTNSIIVIQGATGTGCSIMNGPHTVTTVAGTSVTISLNGTGCTYTGSSASASSAYWTMPTADATGCWQSNGASALSISACPSGLPALDSQIITQNATDPTKQQKFDDSAISTGTTRTYKFQDGNYTLAGINFAETWTADQTYSANILASATSWNIGSVSSYWANVYSQEVVAQTIQITDSTSYLYTYFLGEDTSHRFAMTYKSLYQMMNAQDTLGLNTFTFFNAALLPDTSSDGAIGSPSLPWNNTYTNALQILGISGSTQCLHVNTSGVVSGTGSDCISGSGFVTIATNQTITGQKIFQQSGSNTGTATVIIKQQGSSTDALQCWENSGVTSQVCFDDNADLFVNAGSPTIGTSSNFFPEIYGTTLVGQGLEITNSSAFSHVYILGEDGSFNFTITNGLYEILSLNTVTGAGLMTMFGSIVGSTPGNSLGTSGVPWGFLYLNNTLGGTYSMTGNETVTGNWYNRTFSGAPSCSGVSNGWQGFDTSGLNLDLCSGSTLYSAPFGPWTAYTPTVTNLTGTSSDSAYSCQGKTCRVRIEVSGTGGTGFPTFTLPFTAKNNYTVLSGMVFQSGGYQQANCGAQGSPSIVVANFSVFTSNPNTYFCEGVYEIN